MKKLVGNLLFLALMFATETAFADPPICVHTGPVVALRAGPAGAGSSLEDVGRHLEAGLSKSGVGVCVGAGTEPLIEGRVAQVEIEGERGDVSLRITLTDDVTTKTLQRSVDLSSIPKDSRAVAIAVYIEELLQASWAELALEKRVYLQEHPPNAPPEVKREVESVLPPPSENHLPKRFRLSIGGTVTRFRGGITQVGPELSLGFLPISWIETSARFAYRLSPSVTAADGSIDTRAVLAGTSVSLMWQLSRGVTLQFPQGVDVSPVTFTGVATSSATAASESRVAIVVSHGLGLRMAIGSVFSLSPIARFCWTPLAAEAADNQRVAAGISGIGIEGALSLDAHF